MCMNGSYLQDGMVHKTINQNILSHAIAILTFLCYLGCMCHSWFVKCYTLFEKAQLQCDAEDKVIHVKTDTGQTFCNFLFKCKGCVIFLTHCKSLNLILSQMWEEHILPHRLQHHQQPH